MIETLFQYGAWANSRIFSLAEALTDEQLDSRSPSGSIVKPVAAGRRETCWYRLRCLAKTPIVAKLSLLIQASHSI